VTDRKPYPSDVGDEEWALVAPYLTLLDEGAPQRVHPLREVFNALRWLVRAGASWRMLPHDLPPWPIVYQQTQRWLAAGVFDALVADLRRVLRLADGRAAEPTAAILDSRTLQSTPESGGRAGYDGAKRRKGSKVHLAVDTLGQFLALHVTPASAQDRAQVAALAVAVQEATGEHVELAYVDQGYTGDRPAAPLPRTASRWRWSPSTRSSAASCCCRAGGSWSGVSAGWPASAAWPATMSASPKRSPGSISSPSPSRWRPGSYVC